MKPSEITLVYVDEYLAAEGDKPNVIQGFIDSAKDMVMKSNGYITVDQLDKNEQLTDVILVYIQQMYDTGKFEANKSFNNMITMDRRFD